MTTYVIEIYMYIGNVYRTLTRGDYNRRKKRNVTCVLLV